MINANEYIRQNYMYMTDKEMGKVVNLSVKAVKNRRHRMSLFKNNSNTCDTFKVTGLLDKLEVAMEDIGKVDRVSVNKTRTEKDKGEGVDPEVSEITRTSVTLKPYDADIPFWNPVSQAAPTVIKPLKVVKKNRSLKLALCLPDPQIGFRRNVLDDTLEPFHDETAMNVALSMIRDLCPDLIVNLGDFLDLPQFGKYVQEPGFALTTQPSIDRGHTFLAQQRANAPDAKIVVIEGNHDRRLLKSIIENLAGAFGLRRANAPTEHPVMSIPFLLRMDELDVEYVSGYPASSYYINHGIKCIHGKNSGRGVAGKTLNDEKISTITGHSHHVEMIYRTINTEYGPVRRVGATLGCLSRTDGVVPGFASSIDDNGKIVVNHHNWQQSVGIVYYDEDGQYHTVTPVIIQDGVASYGGKQYIA